jgi:hypothetical protein
MLGFCAFGTVPQMLYVLALLVGALVAVKRFAPLVRQTVDPG